MATVNYTRDVQRFDADPADWTDQEIADILNGETFNPIVQDQAKQHLAAADWWILRQGGVYDGHFEAYQDDPGTPNPVKDFLGNIWTVVFSGSRPDVATTLVYNRNGIIARSDKDDPDGDHLQKQGAYLWAGFFGWALGETDPLLQEDIDDFYSIGGGLKYPAQDVTDQDVADARTAWETEQGISNGNDALQAEYNRVYNLYVAPTLNSQTPNDQAVKDALIAASTNWVDQITP